MATPYAYRQRFPDSSLWKHLQSQRTPALFTLELTARCTLNCRHCYVNRPADDLEVRARELSVDEILGVARQAVELGALWCTLTGGDPLLREDFSEIYLGLKRLGLLVSVFTNATLITEDHTRLWQSYPPRDLEVTVYGASAETYERVTRRPGSYMAFRRGLELLQRAGIPVRLKALALRSNLHELPAIAAFCREHTGDTVRFSSIVHLRTDGDPARNEEISAERLTPQEMQTYRWDDDAACHDHPPTVPPMTPTDPGRLFRCEAGVRDFTVSYDGHYRLCTALTAPGTTMDLRAHTLREAWEILNPAVRGRHTESPAYLARCGACACRHRCFSCPAYAYLDTGAMEGVPEYFCALAHAGATNEVTR